MTRKDGVLLSIFEAAMAYRQDQTPVVVVAGKDYGTGSSRDWAAKGPALLGVRAVLAQSFERIHRSNLVGMGILPLEFQPGEGDDLTGEEPIDITLGDGRVRDGLLRQARPTGCGSGSTPRANTTTTGTAASCPMCSPDWWKPNCCLPENVTSTLM